MQKFNQFSRIRLFFLLVMIFCACKNLTGLYAELPRVAMDDNGNGVAVWEARSPSGLSLIFASTFTAGVWSAPTVISDASSNSNQPRLAISKTSGNAVAIWFSTNSSGVDSIVASQFNGAWTSTALAVGSATEKPERQYEVAISDNAPNTMVAIWTAIISGSLTNFMAHSQIGSPWTSP